MCRAKDGNTGASLDVSKGREVLPTNVKPLHYDLTLEPDFEKFTYEGKVVIEYVQQDMVKLSPIRRYNLLTLTHLVSMSRKTPIPYPSIASR